MSNFEVSVDHELKLVKIIVTGEIFQEDGEKIITVARQTAAEHSYSLFYDIRQATTTVPFAQWFNLPRNLPVFQNPQIRKLAAAILVSPNDKAVEDYKFYEVVTNNLGIKLKIFFDENEAFEWLKANSSK